MKSKQNSKSIRETTFTARLFLPMVIGLAYLLGSVLLVMAEEPLSRPTAKGKEIVRIGIIAPLSLAGNDEHGIFHLQGAKAKFKEMKSDIEDSTNIRLELLVRDSTPTDSQGEAEMALSHAKNLVEKHGVLAILGAVNSHATLAIQQYIESLKGPQAILITSSSTKSSITDKGKNQWTFRNNLSDRKLTQGMAKRMFKKDGISKVAVFYYDNTWGRGAYKDFAESFTKLGGEIVHRESVLGNQQNFESAIAHIADKETQAICIFAGDLSKYYILKTRHSNPRTKDLPVYTIGLPHRLLEKGKEYIKNVTGVSSFYDDPHRNSIQLAKEVLTKYLPPWPSPDLNFNSARAMESMKILLSAIRIVKKADPIAVRNTIRDGEFDGLHYPISFDPMSGDLNYGNEADEGPFFLKHYGQWLDLSDRSVYVYPVVILVAIGLVFGLVYLVAFSKLHLPTHNALFLAGLPATILLMVAEHYELISVGERLSQSNDVLTWCGAIVTIGTMLREMLLKLGRNSEGHEFAGVTLEGVVKVEENLSEQPVKSAA